MSRAWFVFVLTWFTTVAWGAPKKRALLVGVSDYSHDVRWNDLHTELDLASLSGVLRRHKFPRENMVILSNEAATAAGILEALDALVASTGPGDHVFFHYSGHGQQVQDGPDADEADGLDEALAPYGAPSSAEGGYEGALHLRDDQLAAALTALRTRVGPEGSVVVTLDSCHSGSMSRGSPTPEDPQTRGGVPAMVFDPTAVPPRSESNGFSDAAIATTADGALGPLIMLTAARSFERAQETIDPNGNAVGSLSLALTQVLGDPSPPRTWGEAYERVAGQMAQWRQPHVPQLDGDGEHALFNGEYLQAAPYHQVRRVRRDGSQISLRSGSLTGLAVGARVAVHPPGTLEPSGVPLAVGTVASVEATSATVAIDPPDGTSESPFAGLNKQALRVFVTDPAPGQHRLGVRVELDDAVGDAWRAALADDRRFVLNPPAASYVVQFREPGAFPSDPSSCDRGCTAIVPTTRPDALVAFAPGLVGPDASSSENDAQGHAQTLQRVLERLMYGGLLDGATLTGDPAAFSIELGLSWEDTGEPLTRDAASYVVPLTERRVCFSATSKGSRRSYLSLVHVNDRGLPVQLYSDPVRPVPSASQAEPRTVLLRCFMPSGAAGAGILKLFATAEPVDFKALIGGARSTTRGGALQQLLGQLAAGTRSTASGEGATSTVRYDMVVP